MIIESPTLKGMKCDLAHLDQTAESLGFVRWQWDYNWATYEFKYEDKANLAEYYLRLNTRAESGKLESPYAILRIEDAYIGKATFPHGLDYNAPVPEAILKASEHKIREFQKKLSE